MTNFDITKLFDQEYRDTLPKITKKNPARVGDILIHTRPNDGWTTAYRVDMGDMHSSAWSGYVILHREPMTWPSGSILVEGNEFDYFTLRGTRIPENVAPSAPILRWVLKDQVNGFSDAEIEEMLAENPKLRVITPEEMK